MPNRWDVNKPLRLSDRRISVASLTLADAGRALDRDNSHAPTMAPTPVAAEVVARPQLTLASRDEIAAAVQALDWVIGIDVAPLEGDVTQIDGPSLMFCRHATPSRRPTVIDIPSELCSANVKAKLYDLLVAIEAEAKRVAVLAPVAAVALTLLPPA